MNSQRKQQSKSGSGIKTDKYGVPLNFGNYKNGRLIVKKGGGGGGGGKAGGNGKNGNRGGGGGGNQQKTSNQQNSSGRGGGNHQQSSKKQLQKQQQQQNNNMQLQKMEKKKENLASVGLTGAAHTVIKEALIMSSSSSNPNLQLLDETTISSAISNFDCTAPTTNQDGSNLLAAAGEAPTTRIRSNNNNYKNNNKPEEEATTTTTRRNNRNNNTTTNRRSSPNLEPPPMIENNGGKGNNDSFHNNMGPMSDQRRNLPVYNFKDELLQTIQNHPVIIVEGETGSGKTTQVPQYCIEDAALKNISCNIIIAQPRRISAMSVAERVANERGESIGTTIGYTIRLESKATNNTRLLFCTTGILLKRLEEDPMLHNITHVFVDEVHERSIESDFLLMVLRDMLPKRDPTFPLKVVLMSATLDASLFHDYFWGAPSVKFPGRTFPVTELYLEDALEVTGHVVKGNEDWCIKGGGGGGGPKRNNTATTSGGGGSAGSGSKPTNGKKFSAQEVVTPLQDRDDMLLSPTELATRYAKYSPKTQAALSKLDHNAINYDLVVDTIQWLSNLSSPLEATKYLKGSPNNNNSNKLQLQQEQKGSGGDAKKVDTTSSAILVFLPGIKEITTLQELLVKSLSSPAAREWVLPIHSTIPPEEQRRVFTRPPKGIRKVVLATNIAETAITIDDVAFVVDTGRMKENRYDPLKRMSSLEDCLVARSNARQRRGRAGRVRDGVAVHLFTKHRHDKITMAAQTPEVQRVPLEQLVLRIKALQYPGTAAEVCARLVEPPAPQAVQRAVEELVFLEAMMVNKSSNGSKNNEELTALGVHLSTLPVDCRIGKLILLGAMFGVTDDALTIAATLSYRNPFMSPMAARDEADRAKMTFATAQSDHLTVLNAYKQVENMGKLKYDFCRENFLSIKTLQTIAGLKRQFLELLSAAGFVRPNLRSRAVEALGRRNGGCDGVALALKNGLGGSGGGGRGGTKNGGGRDAVGDWKCPKCSVNNFARNTTSCFKCKTAKPTIENSQTDLVVQEQTVTETTSPVVERVLMGADDENEFEKSLPLLKALLVAALFPQMVIVDDSKSAGGGKKGGGGGGGGMTLKARTENGEKQEEMTLHPSCITGQSKGALSSKYLVYHERVKTTRVYIRDATPVSPYALILFGGGRMDVKHCPRGGTESVLRLDGWVGFKCPRKDHLLVMELREVLDGILRHKVENPKKDFTEEGASIIDAVKAILTMDEDGKVMAPERRQQTSWVDNAFDMLHKRNTNSNNGGNKRSGRGGGGKGGGRGATSSGRGGRGRGGKR